MFSEEISEKLKTYVYRLIDPRNGETFYVGKGKNNRVFSHIQEEENLHGDELDNKLKRIREIKAAGFQVAHVIHRHGMDDRTALEVEAALIDAYPGLTNIVFGIGSSGYGVMHADEIIRHYQAKEAVFEHKAILISINTSYNQRSLYDATRYCWKLSRLRAEEAEIVLAAVKGIIKAAFIPKEWLEATAENFPGTEDIPGRLGFIGEKAPEEIAKLYINKRIPDEYRKRGASNPVRYTW